MPDIINHPPHYTEHPSGIECVQITEHMGFNLGNAVKYIWRCDLKKDAIEDLKKARWYIEREIAKREASQEDVPGLQGLFTTGVLPCGEIKFAGTDGYLVNRRLDREGQWKPGDEVDVYPVSLGGPHSQWTGGDSSGSSDGTFAVGSRCYKDAGSTDAPGSPVEIHREPGWGFADIEFYESTTSDVESVLPHRRQGCCE